jgi:hypothetical protein
VSWKQRREAAGDLRPVYTAPTAEAATLALDRFAEKWDLTHPTISLVWRRNWERVIPFFAFPPEIRKVIYTTNAVESLNMSLRKIIKTRGSFPNEEAAIRLLYLALRNHSKKWSFVQSWREALNRFQILWPERMPALKETKSTRRWQKIIEDGGAAPCPRDLAPGADPGYLLSVGADVFARAPVSDLDGARGASPHCPVLRQILSTLTD